MVSKKRRNSRKKRGGQEDLLPPQNSGQMLVKAGQTVIPAQQGPRMQKETRWGSMTHSGRPAVAIPPSRPSPPRLRPLARPQKAVAESNLGGGRRRRRSSRRRRKSRKGGRRIRKTRRGGRRRRSRRRSSRRRSRRAGQTGSNPQEAQGAAADEDPTPVTSQMTRQTAAYRPPQATPSNPEFPSEEKKAQLFRQLSADQAPQVEVDKRGRPQFLNQLSSDM